MPQNEKNSAVHNKKITRDNLYKNTKEQLKKSVIYTYNQQPKGNSARQTRAQHLSSNIPNHSQ